MSTMARRRLAELRTFDPKNVDVATGLQWIRLELVNSVWFYSHAKDADWIVLLLYNKWQPTFAPDSNACVRRQSIQPNTVVNSGWKFCAPNQNDRCTLWSPFIALHFVFSLLGTLIQIEYPENTTFYLYLDQVVLVIGETPFRCKLEYFTVLPNNTMVPNLSYFQGPLRIREDKARVLVLRRLLLHNTMVSNILVSAWVTIALRGWFLFADSESEAISSPSRQVFMVLHFELKCWNDRFCPLFFVKQ